MASLSKLEDHPGLADWYRLRTAPANDMDAASHRLVRSLCAALCAPEPAAIAQWLEALSCYWSESTTTLRTFLAAESFVQSCDADLMDLISEFGEGALRHGLGDKFLQIMREGADRTGLVALRFLAAWAALNLGRQAECITECDRVDEPFGAILTLQGQALLESGRCAEAIHALCGATKLAPHEIVAWFQLAKAYHVGGQNEDAMAALGQCQMLAPQSEEVALFMALIAVEASTAPEYVTKAWQALLPHLSTHANEPSVVFALAGLALRTRSKKDFGRVVAGARWEPLATQPGFLSQLANLLRSLQEVGWLDMAGEVLQKLVPNPRAA